MALCVVTLCLLALGQQNEALNDSISINFFIASDLTAYLMAKALKKQSPGKIVLIVQRLS